MGIGSHISERRLIDELTRMGMNESIVSISYYMPEIISKSYTGFLIISSPNVFQIRRALLIMHQRDEVEYKRERHVIVRKA